MNVVAQRTARSTGSAVSLVDNRDQSFEEMGEGYSDAETRQLARDGRWATVCETHHTYCLHATRAVATSFMAAPEEWCESCADEIEKEG